MESILILAICIITLVIVISLFVALMSRLEKIDARSNDNLTQAELISQLEVYQAKQSAETFKNSTEHMLQVSKLMNDSFKQMLDSMSKNKLESDNRLSNFQARINEQLESVSRSAGEMTKIGEDVRSLNKTLSNVKTRGTVGELRLEALLGDCLSPNQFSHQVQIKPDTLERVDFAINLPGHSGQTIMLPIDSKWPIEDYEAIISAETTDEEAIARKALFGRIEGFARDISSKYILPPKTTDFAILYLPTDCLYLEVVRDAEIFEKLRSKYHIILAGPTTLFAIVDSISIGFKTLAIEQKSREVWEVLKETQDEFQKFSKVLDDCLKQINTVENTLTTLKTTRTNQINRKLAKLEDYETVSQ